MTDVTHVDRASQAWLTDPTVFEVNRTPAHSSHKWYARDPQSGQWSDLKQSLDGEWRVEVVQAADINLEEEPATAESFDDSSFERIQVPGHLQTAGLMNHKYVNVQYPWDGHENPLEPNIPENNHVALYRRKFTVSAPVANPVPYPGGQADQPRCRPRADLIRIDPIVHRANDVAPDFLAGSRGPHRLHGPC